MATGQHTDPVCGMRVEADEAAGQSEFRGQTYYFCSEGCKERFKQNPEQYAEKSKEANR
jgi:Cu+-exporting ATPase